MQACVVRAYVRASAAPAFLPRRVLFQEADFVREKAVQELSVRAVRLLDLVADKVITTAGEHLNPMTGGDIGEGVCQLDSVVAREVVERDAGFTVQHVGVPKHFAVEYCEAEVAPPRCSLKLATQLLEAVQMILRAGNAGDENRIIAPENGIRPIPA